MSAPRSLAQLSPRPFAPPSPWQQAPLVELRRAWEEAQRAGDLGSLHGEFLELSQENDPALLRQALLGLARRLRATSRDGLADRVDAALGASTRPHPVEAFVGRFAEEALNPIALAAMGLAGVAYRATRLGVLSRLLGSPEAGVWTRGWGAQWVAKATGFFAEVSTFTLSHAVLGGANSNPGNDSLAKKLATNAWFLGALKFSGGLAQRSLPWLDRCTNAGVARAWQPLAAQAAGLALARKGEVMFGWRQAQPADAEAVDVAATLLQFHIAGSVLQRLPGKTLPTPDTRRSSPQWAAAQAFPGIGDTGKNFPPHLWRAISETPNYGSKPHLLTVEALDRLYLYDAAGSATGSLQNALWQSLVQEASRDPNEARGRRALLAALAVMEHRPERNALLQVAQQFGYAGQWRLSKSEFPAAAAEIQKLPGRERFSVAEINLALESGKDSPYGKIILRRLREIVATGDIPGKLRELWKQESFDTAATLERLRDKGFEGEALAALINNTAHTAYLDDLRVARKVVSVYEEVTPFLRAPRLRDRNLKKLRRDFSEVWQRHPKLDADAIIDFLTRQADPQAKAFLQAVQQGKVELEMVSPNAFDEYVRGNGVPESCSLSLFLKPRNPLHPSLIWLRAMPEGLSLEDPEAAFAEFSSRAVALFHEWEHYRHFHGEFGPKETSSHPFDIQRLGREERLASETMALLEQLRWGIQHLDEDFYQVSRRLGENLAQFSRGIADWGYFGKPRN